MAVLGSSLPANVLAPDSFSTACSNSVCGPRFLTFSAFKQTTGRHIYTHWPLPPGSCMSVRGERSPIFLVFLGLSQQLPVAVSTLLLFVAHLHELRYSPASIQSIMSAVSYFHKAHNLFDPTRAFLISKAIIGARNLSQSVDIRLPVTPSVLSKLVASTYHVFVSPYKSLMMRMIMVLAFQAYLRIGEMIPRSKSDVHGCLRLGDVVIVEDVLTVNFAISNIALSKALRHFV